MTLIAMFEECETPLPPIACAYDFGATDSDWNVTCADCFGVYSAGNGFEGVSRGAHSLGAVRINHPLSGSNIISEIRVTVFCLDPGSGPNQNIQIALDRGSGFEQVARTDLLDGTNTVVAAGPFENVSEIWLAANTGDTDAVPLIKAARYTGVGDSGCG